MSSPSPVPDTVTVTMTSCGRLDLLQQTLDSFRRHNPGGRYIISEDSADPEVIAAVRAMAPDAQVLYAETRTGLMASLDRLFSAVGTPYIFHLEDDWLCDGPVDWETAMQGLERPGVAQVCVRVFDEIRPKWRKHSTPFQIGGHQFAHMHADAHPEFFGWSPNPGLFRTDIYHRYKPFHGVTPDQMSARIKRDNQTMAFLLPGIAHHIGGGRNIHDPTEPPRPKSKIGKFMRGFRKKLYYIGLRKTPY
jgi:hypothetical protein